MPPHPPLAERSSMSARLEGTLFALRLIKESADALPPLKAVVAGTLSVVESIKYKEGDADWGAFGLLVAERVKLFTDRVSHFGHHHIDEFFHADIDSLLGALNGINTTIQIRGKSSKWKKFLRAQGDIALLLRVKEEFANADRNFSMATDLHLRQALIHLAPSLSNSHPNAALSDPVFSTREIPEKPSYFYGRDDFIKNVATKLIEAHRAGSPARVSIHGEPRLGKTASSLSILHHEEVQSFFGDRRHFIRCESALNPHLLLRALASGVQVITAENQTDLLHHIKKTLLAIESPILLVLDNFETCWNCGSRHDMQIILEHLASLQNVSLIVTMRGNGPDGTFWTTIPQLDVLDAESARKVFAKVAGSAVDLDSDALNRILRDAGYLPQAIHLLANLVKKGETLTSIYTRWLDERTALISQGSSERQYNLDLSFQLSISSRPMDECPWALRLLSTIACLPDGISGKEVENVTRIPRNKVHHAAHTLCEVGLARREAGLLRAIAPIRLHVTQYFPSAAEDTLQTRQHYCTLIRLAVETEKWQEKSKMIDDIAPKLGNIHEMLNSWITSKEQMEEAASVALDLAKFLFVTPYRTDLIERILDCEPLTLSKSMRAALLHMQGMSLAMTNDYGPAASRLHEARNVYQDLQDEVGQVACTWAIGDLHREQGRYNDARHFLNLALDGYNRLGSGYRASQGACLCSMADILGTLGECQEGLRLAHTALEIYKELDDQTSVAAVTIVCAGLEMDQGSLLRALTLLRTTTEQCERDKDTFNLRDCFLQSGKLFCYMGDTAQARLVLDQAKVFFEQKALKQRLADTFRYLATAALEEKNYSEAQSYLEQAQAIYHGMGHQLHMADIRLSFAHLRYYEGSKEEAKLLYLEAQEYYRKIGCRRGIAACLVCVAKIKVHKQENLTEAVAQFREAASVYRCMGNTTKAAQCLQMAENAENSRHESENHSSETIVEDIIPQYTLS